MRRRTRSATHIFILSAFTAVLLLSLLAGGCSSTPKPIPEDLEPIEYFQEAQKLAMEQGDYQNAIRWYRTFIQRHPDDIQHVVEAQYEIAFLHYKQGNYQTSEQEFDKLLSYYEGGGKDVLPEWPQILANKLLKEIESESAGSSEEPESEAGSSAGGEGS
jgi:tetratricopeptide (TPR) repeat protein